MPLPEPHAPIRCPVPLRPGERFHLGPASVPALALRQVRCGEGFTLQDAAGHFWRARLLSLGDHGTEALAYEAMPRSPESPLELSLACAVLQRERMFWVLQKATELGVARLLPFFAERSATPADLPHEKAHAWPRVVVRAAKQCRRASLPVLAAPVPLPELLAGPEWSAAELRLFLDDRAPGAPPLTRGPERVVLAAGPEGGWTDAERARLREAGAAPLALGGRVLRAETAAICGVAVIQHRLGDLGPGGT